MKILITGGAGFIGRNLTEKLLKEGHKVLCLDNFLTSDKSNIEAFQSHENFEFILHDVKEPLPLNDKLDYVFHLAAPASPEFYYSDPINTFATIVKGTWNVVDYILKFDVPCIYTSTSEVYGDPLQHPQTESYWGNVNPIGLRSCYDEGKRASEALIFDYIRCKGARIKVVRVFNTYGPYMHPRDGRVVSNFIMQALQDKPITIYGDGSQTRSFQYVDDLVNALCLLMNVEEDFHGPINLGNPDEFTILKLAKEILSMIPTSKSEIIFKPLPQDDPIKRKPDIALAKQILAWEPKVLLNEGLVKTVAHFSQLNF